MVFLSITIVAAELPAQCRLGLTVRLSFRTGGDQVGSQPNADLAQFET
jgi:hypothetical protein